MNSEIRAQYLGSERPDFENIMRVNPEGINTLDRAVETLTGNFDDADLELIADFLDRSPHNSEVLQDIQDALMEQFKYRDNKNETTEVMDELKSYLLFRNNRIKNAHKAA